MTAPVISVKDLYKKFGNFYALNGATFDLEGGRIHGFVGPNGAGKTTTMKIIMGAIRPSAGTAFVKNYEVGSVEAKKLLGYSPEFPSFYQDMTALEYLVYMSLLGRVSYREACYRAEDLLDLMGLRSFRDKKVAKFSTGMKKKVGLAQAMIHDPEILLLDEPTANLDPTSRMDIIDSLKALVEEKKITLMISSHVLSELEQIITDVTLIDKGKIVRQGPISEIAKNINRGQFILATSDNAKMSAWLYDAPFVYSVTDLGNGKLKVVVEDENEFKKFVISKAAQEGIVINHMAEDAMSLESIYKTIIMEGGNSGEGNI